MRVLVTGCRGQLGRALAGAAAARGDDAVGVDLPDFDVTDEAMVGALLRDVRPHWVVNAAAFTAVDEAERREAEAAAVNATAVEYLVAAADAVGAGLVHVSTDYVFDGLGRRPYREDDPVAPRSAYGRTKLAGERAAARGRRVLIARTAWLYGEGANFVAAIRRQIDAGTSTLRVVADQRGCPTSAVDLAAALLALADADARGLVHVVNAGSATWHELACEIVRLLGAPVEVEAVTTGEMPRPAPRPAYSVLDTTRLATLLGRALPPWQDALARYLGAVR